MIEGQTLQYWGSPSYSPKVADGKLTRYCALAPEISTTCAHFSMSARRYLSKSAGLIGIGTAPCLAQLSFTSGRFMILVISPLSLVTTSVGVPFGAMMPSQIVAS